MKNLLYLAIIGAAIYLVYTRYISPPPVPQPEQQLVTPSEISQATPQPTPQEPPHSPGFFPKVVLTNQQVLLNVTVRRADPDGFVIGTSRGIIKIWNNQISPELHTAFKACAPSPTPYVNPMDSASRKKKNY